MKNQAKSMMLALALGCCILCSFLALGIFATLSNPAVQRTQALPAEIEAMGSQPPDAADVTAAFPAQVGAYQLDAQKTSYDYYLAANVDAATYAGPDGEVELTLVLSPSVTEAQNYVKQRKAWIDGNLKATQSLVDLPGKQLIIYDATGQYGRIWNSQAWVIDIQATTRAARDNFFAAFPYR